MRKDILVGGGIACAVAGAFVGSVLTMKHFKNEVKKEVKESISKQIKQDVADMVDIDEVRKEAAEKVTTKVGYITDKKLENFDARLRVMEDIDAKQLEVEKALIIGVVIVSTTLIKAVFKTPEQTCQLPGDDLVC